jgi:hypothetical protein
VKIVKNKVAPPFKTVQVDIINSKGISKNAEILELGIEKGEAYLDEHPGLAEDLMNYIKSAE